MHASNSLSKQKCKPCENIGARFSKEQINAHLKHIKNWQCIKNHHLVKSFSFPDFKSALNFVNKVGKLAEKEAHHPDIQLSWGKVEITLFTHALDVLTINDFILASKIDKRYKQ